MMMDDHWGVNKVGRKKVEIAAPWKHMSNFWRSISIPLFNFELSLVLTWSANSVISNMTKWEVTVA